MDLQQICLNQLEEFVLCKNGAICSTEIIHLIKEILYQSESIPVIRLCLRILTHVWEGHKVEDRKLTLTALSLLKQSTIEKSQQSIKVDLQVEILSFLIVLCQGDSKVKEFLLHNCRLITTGLQPIDTSDFDFYYLTTVVQPSLELLNLITKSLSETNLEDMASTLVDYKGTPVPLIIELLHLLHAFGFAQHCRLTYDMMKIDHTDILELCLEALQRFSQNQKIVRIMVNNPGSLLLLRPLVDSFNLQNKIREKTAAILKKMTDEFGSLNYNNFDLLRLR